MKRLQDLKGNWYTVIPSARGRGIYIEVRRYGNTPLRLWMPGTYNPDTIEEI